MTDFLMPKLGADMTAGTLVAWRKQPGDAVHRGDIVAEVETEKGIIDVEIFVNGVIDRWLVEPGQKVPVGTPLAVIRGEQGGIAPSVASVAPAAEPTATPSAEERPARPAEVKPEPIVRIDATRLRISPAARRRARELGVDPTNLVGTGHGGAITIEDIEAVPRITATSAVSEAAQTVVATQTRPRTASLGGAPDKAARLRQSIAAAMARSKREIPHYYLATTIDLAAALRWMAEKNARLPVTERLLPGVMLIKAVALALREVPELNSVWDQDHVVRQTGIHVGVAISLRQGGLVAPALHDTDKQTLVELMANLRDLVNRTRAGSLRSSELSDPTITLTNLGEQGVETVFGVIYPPQVALVGFGKIVERPWSVNGAIVSRPVISATLSADHRVSDGHRGGLLLSAIDRLLQEPEKL